MTDEEYDSAERLQLWLLSSSDLERFKLPPSIDEDKDNNQNDADMESTSPDDEHRVSDRGFLPSYSSSQSERTHANVSAFPPEWPATAVQEARLPYPRLKAVSGEETLDKNLAYSGDRSRVVVKPRLRRRNIHRPPPKDEVTRERILA